MSAGLITRIRYKLAFSSLTGKFNVKTGEGVAPLSYSIFSDRVEVRFSRIGRTTIPSCWMPREQFIKLMSSSEWDRVTLATRTRP